MTAVDDLTGNTLNFMASNLVVVPFEGAGNDTKDEPLEMALYTLSSANSTAKKEAGGAAGLYFLTKASVLAYSPGATLVGKFQAYFCPYRSNDTLGTVISNKATLMFTAAMDGCSFGVGSAGTNGERLVYHSNLANMGSASDTSKQGAVQDMTLKLVLGASAETIISPTAYRGDGRSTTFGLRNGANWAFYTQRYSV